MNRIRGRVDGLAIRFLVEAENGASAEVDLDTGFTGQLALDSATLTTLGFGGPVALASVELGDGSRVDTPVYEGRLRWFDSSREVAALLTTSPVGSLGMALLSELIIHIDMKGSTAHIEKPE